MIRLVLDNCVIRNLCHRTEPLIELGQLVLLGDKIALSIGNSAYSELTQQVLEKRVPFEDWRRVASELNAVLASDFPVMPGGNELAIMAGLRDDKIDWTSSQRYHRAVWMMLSEPSTYEAFLKGRAIFNENGGKNVIRVRPEEIVNKMLGYRKQWAEKIKAKLGQMPDASAESIRESVLTELLPRYTGDHDYREPLSCVAECLIQLLTMASKRGSDDYFEKTRRKGDFFDFDLLFATAIPAIVCTEDGLSRRVRQAKSPRCQFVMSIEEVNARLADDSLISHYNGLVKLCRSLDCG